MRLLVCGGEDVYDKNKIFEALDKLSLYSYITHVITGGSGGTDYFVHQWASRNRCEAHVIVKKNDKTDKIAETIHGQDLIKYGNPNTILLINNSEKVKIMKKLAKKAGITVVELEV